MKYDDPPESKNNVTIKYIEIVDPRGNSYKFVMDASLKSGESITLPRKPGTKPREEDGWLLDFIFPEIFLVIFSFFIPHPIKIETKETSKKTDPEPEKKPEPEAEKKNGKNIFISKWWKLNSIRIRDVRNWEAFTHRFCVFRY